MKDLNKFMGSKYAQSTIGDSYKQVKDFLDNDRYVLFTGTPCQIEGLKSYLRKDYDKFIYARYNMSWCTITKSMEKIFRFSKSFNNENIKPFLLEIKMMDGQILE